MTTLSTSSTSDNDISSTSYDLLATTTTTALETTSAAAITNAYCQCESAESWDDFHYYEEDGTLVILSNEYQAAQANVIVSDQAMVNQKQVSASDMMVHSNSKISNDASSVALM